MENLKRTIGDASNYITKAVYDSHITDEASVLISRAKQYTEEKLGKCERTEDDDSYVTLAEKTDIIKSCTEKIVNDAEAVLIPNPAIRLESFVADSVPGAAADKMGLKHDRMTNLEYLGNDMMDAGNNFGSETPYGSALIQVGRTQHQLGLIERQYIKSGHESLVSSLQNFLNQDMKNIVRERKVLENKRLDLDSCKNKVKKCKAALYDKLSAGAGSTGGGRSTTSDKGPDPHALLDQAECEMRIAQTDFDRQVEICRMMMEGLSSIQKDHLSHLLEFVKCEKEYYANCHDVMVQLHKSLYDNTNQTSSSETDSVHRSQIVRNINNNPQSLSAISTKADGASKQDDHSRKLSVDMQEIDLNCKGDTTAA